MVTEDLLTAEEQMRLRVTIAEAEAGTSGEIYVVLDRSPDEFFLVPVLWAALFALLLPWLLLTITSFSTTTILIVQAAAFVVTAAIFAHPTIRMRIVPGVMAEDAVHRTARAAFLAHGVHMTEARTGVLIYLSLMPRRIEILADSGIHARVGEAMWRELLTSIAAEARSGRLAEGLAAAIGAVGALLAQHFPRQAHDRNELPDRVVEM